MRVQYLLVSDAARARRISLFLALVMLACGGSREAEKKAREDADYHYNLAYGYYFDRTAGTNADAALVEVRLALKAKEDHVNAHMLTGLIHLGNRQYLKAERHFKRCLELDTGFLKCANNLGTTYLQMERWDEAIEVFQGLLASNEYGRPGIALNNLGWAYYKKGERRMAFDRIQRAKAKDPRLCPPYNNLGLIYYEDGNFRKAEKSFEKAVEKCPGYAEAHFHLGRLQLRSTRVDEARRSFQKCLKFGGESPLAERCEERLATLPPPMRRRR